MRRPKSQATAPPPPMDGSAVRYPLHASKSAMCSTWDGERILDGFASIGRVEAEKCDSPLILSRAEKKRLQDSSGLIEKLKLICMKIPTDTKDIKAIREFLTNMRPPQVCGMADFFSKPWKTPVMPVVMRASHPLSAFFSWLASANALASMLGHWQVMAAHHDRSGCTPHRPIPRHSFSSDQGELMKQTAPHCGGDEVNIL